MRIKDTQRGNDIIIAHRPNGGVAIEQGRSHILVNRQELRYLLDALSEYATDFKPPARIQRFVDGVEQF